MVKTQRADVFRVDIESATNVTRTVRVTLDADSMYTRTTPARWVLTT